MELSPRALFEQPTVAGLAAFVAEATGADANLLEIELTESQLLDDVERASDVLTAVRERGIKVAIDDFETELQPGDRLLLCSDGLNGMVPDTLIATLLGAGSPEEAAWSLIEAANSAGGYDNITTLVVAVER